VTVGPLDLTDYYFEHKWSQMEAYPRVFDVARQVFDEFADLTGRRYGFWEEYKLDDAETVMIILGSSAGTAKDVVDEYREKGVKVGLLKLRMFRPFPAEMLRPLLEGRKAIGVLDRSASFGGWGGPVFTEVRSAMYGTSNPAPIHNWIYGLGGRDFELGHAAEAIEALQKIAAGEELPTHNLLGCRA
jgi:pyruvate ferredoxin oxidoreductase alpha subunit